MESLVNYSSEDEQDEYHMAKVAVRERERVSSGGGGNNSSSYGRNTIDANSGGGHLKRSYEHQRVGSSERDVSPYRKSRDVGNERTKGGSTNFCNEDRYKIDRRSEKSKDHREIREKRDPKNNKDLRDDSRDHGNGHKYDYKNQDEYKRFRDPKREHKREDNDHYRDDKRYNRYDRKSTYSTNYKDRFNSSKSRYDDRFNSDDRRGSVNEDRRGGGGNYSDDRRREHIGDRRNDDDGRKSDRRYNDDRRTQRSYNEDRANNTYRSRRSSSPTAVAQRNYSDRKDDFNSRRERKRHSRSRSRSRSNSAEKSSASISIAHNNPHQRTTETLRPEEEPHVSEKKPLPTARNFEALLTLPLSESAPKQPNVVVPAASASIGSSSTASVQLPSYYNPNVINPNKYVEQMQKRKLIWGAKKSEDAASKWGHAQFSQDQDGKVASKFMRLMGIKNAPSTESSVSQNDDEKRSSSSTTPPKSADVKSREAMFSTMEQQYEVARQVTHTMRGVGLGFSSQPRPF